MMSGYAELSPAEAQELMQAEDACVIDIRDDNSFSSAHITGAIQLDQTSLESFLESTESSMSKNWGWPFAVPIDAGSARVIHIVCSSSSGEKGWIEITPGLDPFSWFLHLNPYNCGP